MNLHESVFAAVLSAIFLGLAGASRVIFAATDPSIIAAVLAATGAIVAGVFSLRSKVADDLVDDVMADREYLKSEVIRLRAEVDALKMQASEREAELVRCQEAERRLKERLRELGEAA